MIKHFIEKKKKNDSLFFRKEKEKVQFFPLNFDVRPFFLPEL
jgi:hypothetical protein